jgi:rRNA-processing protein FCF1
VSVKTEIIIKDACILFDLIDLQLLGHFYELNLTVLTTPQVISEVTNEEQLIEITHYVDNGKLIIDGAGIFEEIVEIIDTNPGLSFTDGSVMELAIRKHAAILSSDKSLRNESQRRNIPVNGMIWIINELCTQKILEVSRALDKLKTYPEINNRAPKADVEKLIKKLSGN